MEKEADEKRERIRRMKENDIDKKSSERRKRGIKQKIYEENWLVRQRVDQKNQRTSRLRNGRGNKEKVERYIATGVERGTRKVKIC